MLFYRVKPESDGKPYLVKKRGGIEYWSAMARGELLTPNEVSKRNISMENLEAVEVNRRKTHFVGPYRLPDTDASITPVHVPPTETRTLPKEVAEQVAKAAATRPYYTEGKRQPRGQLKVYHA